MIIQSVQRWSKSQDNDLTALVITVRSLQLRVMSHKFCTNHRKDEIREVIIKLAQAH